MITFNEFIDTDIDETKIIIDYYLNYLEEFSNKEFPFDEQIKLKGIGNKFVTSIFKTTYINPDKKIQYIELLKMFDSNYMISESKSMASILKTLFNDKKEIKINRRKRLYAQLYSFTLDLVFESKEKTTYYDQLRINDFFTPDKSNKDRIKELINEAIDIINKDDSLTDKTKESIISYLEKAINDLSIEHVNWNKFLGRIKETIIILGAVGSFAGCILPFAQAQNKLEEAANILQNTSINYNYQTINNTYNIKNLKQLGVMNAIIALPESENIPKEIEIKTRNY